MGAMPDRHPISRRAFLKGGAAFLLGAPYIIPSKVWGAKKRISPSNRIVMGTIGVGGQGTGDMENFLWSDTVQMVAVCDVDRKHREDAQKKVEKHYSENKPGGPWKGCASYNDFRELLARDDIDAVLIATPDHWHASISIDACEAGKDVYCEKPMTLYWEEAKQVAEVVRRTGRVFQVGVQSTSDDVWWQANRLIREGAIGKVLWSQSGYCRNSRGGEWNWGLDENCSPQNLDWDLWLGPAPKRPFDKERFFRFRKYWDYSGGIATDLFFHALGHMAIALGPEFPRRVSASGGIYSFPDREVPDTFHSVIDYPSNHTVILASSMANRQGLPEVIRGHEATMTFEGGQVVIRPEDEYQGERPEVRVSPQPRADHTINWLDCIRSREKPDCDAETGYRVAVAISLGVKAYREQKVIEFDPEKEEVVG